MALSCDLLPEHQNLTCKGTFVAKTPEALSQYASTLKIKDGMPKNLTIDFDALNSRVRWVFRNSTAQQGNLFFNFAYLWDHSSSSANRKPKELVNLKIEVLDVPPPTFELPFLKPYWQFNNLDPTGYTVYTETGDSFTSFAECPTSGLPRLYNIEVKTKTTIPVEDNPWGGSVFCLDTAFSRLSSCDASKDVQHLAVCNAVYDCVYAPISQLLESNDILYNKCFADWI